jgi:hypothetical protein
MKKLSVCAPAQPLRATLRPAFKTPARSRCRLKGERASQKPFDGDPYTRARDGRTGQHSYGTRMCSFQGAHDVPTSALTVLTLLPGEINEQPRIDQQPASLLSQ